MSAPANVLAVIEAEIAKVRDDLARYRRSADKARERKGERDIHADRLCEWAEHRLQAMDKARAAIAELIETNRKIVAEWNYMAKHGHCNPGTLGVGQTFDCWAVDLCESALAAVGVQS